MVTAVMLFVALQTASVQDTVRSILFSPSEFSLAVPLASRSTYETVYPQVYDLPPTVTVAVVGTHVYTGFEAVKSVCVQVLLKSVRAVAVSVACMLEKSTLTSV